jgi:hypothetical protein
MRLVGRESNYKSLNKALSDMIRYQRQDSAIAISGMGGIGYFYLTPLDQVTKYILEKRNFF